MSVIRRFRSFDPLAPSVTQMPHDHDAIDRNLGMRADSVGRYFATHLNPPLPPEVRDAPKPEYVHGPPPHTNWNRVRLPECMVVVEDRNED